MIDFVTPVERLTHEFAYLFRAAVIRVCRDRDSFPNDLFHGNRKNRLIRRTPAAGKPLTARTPCDVNSPLSLALDQAGADGNSLQ
ncbi:hypothetical protein [Pelomonas cellulosilytica]|uniref:Uncharacterized protein n=1 Tax=Pelomonas cellulosilytica TaxID=2906762 RepID=A0ABS8XV93_9BURK|nr:hypothetical protein [Pelomonas sp. P8]MCE4554639.1 hypothetical protein [Pelomonas sp. P8]